MLKCGFHKVAWKFHWNHTLVWVFSYKFAFWTPFYKNTNGGLVLHVLLVLNVKVYYFLSVLCHILLLVSSECIINEYYCPEFTKDLKEVPCDVAEILLYNSFNAKAAIMETSQLICFENQLTGFYMMPTLAFNELIWKRFLHQCSFSI